MATRAVIREHICVSPPTSCDRPIQGSQKVHTVSFNAVRTKFWRICSGKTTGNMSFTIPIKIKIEGICVKNQYKLTVGRIVIWNCKYKFPVRSRYRLRMNRLSWNYVKYFNIICGFVFSYSKQWDKRRVSETIAKKKKTTTVLTTRLARDGFSWSFC